MSKVNVEICVGTTCYILGASELQELENFLPDDIREKVDISGTTCMGMCKDKNYGKAPFARVNGEVIAHATVTAIIEKIQQALNAADKA